MTTKNETFTRIARKHLHIETLETRNSDGLDFHDVGVAGVQQALEAAYRAGQMAAKTHSTENPKPEELLDDALRDNLSPEAISVIVAYLQPAKSNDHAADAQVRWFSDRLVALLGKDEFRRMQDELGL